MLPTSVHLFSTFKSNEPWTPYKLQYTCLFPIIFTFLCRILFWLNLYLLKKPLYFMIKGDVQKNLIIQSILATNQLIEKNYHCPKKIYCCSNCFEQCSNNVVGNFQPHLVAFSCIQLPDKVTKNFVTHFFGQCSKTFQSPFKTFNKTNGYAQKQTTRVLNSSNLTNQIHLVLVNTNQKPSIC